MSSTTSLKELISSSRAILFDVDGTLVDSNSSHADAWAKALNKHGHAFSAKTLGPWIGKGGDKILKELVGIDDKGEEGQQISKDRSEIFKKDYVPKLKAFDHAADLVSAFNAKGFRTAIATSAQGDELKSILSSSKLQNTFQIMTSADDAEDSKPDPDIIEAALQKLKVEPSEAILIGDTPYDVQAGLAAGVKVIAVRSGGWDDRSLKGASLIFENVADILQNLERLH